MREDSAPPPRRRRAWPWVLGAFAGVPVLALALWGWAVSRARVILKDAHAEALVELEKLRRRDWSRPPLGGVALEGNAWDYYQQHLPALDSLTGDERMAMLALNGGAGVPESPDDAALAKAYERLKPAIDGMRRGAGCGRATVALEDVIPWRGPGALEEFGACIYDLSGYCVRTGKEAEAAQLLAIGWSVSLDASSGTGSSGIFIRSRMERYLAYATLDFLALLSPSPGSLDLLESCIEAGTRAPLNLLLACKEQRFLDAITIVTHECPVPPFPKSLTTCRCARELAPARSLGSWSIERVRELQENSVWYEELCAFLQTSSPETSMSPASAKSDSPPQAWARGLLHSQAWGLAHRRLARAALALVRYQLDHRSFPGRIEDLVPRYLASVPLCPLSGQPFRTRDGAVWSVGEDGVDNGGTAAPGGNDPTAAGTDLVFKVRQVR